MGPAAVRPFLPVNPKPAQVFEHRRNKFRAAAVRIKVFVTEYQRVARLLCPLRRNQESSSRAQGEKTRRRGRNASAIRKSRHTCIVISRIGLAADNLFRPEDSTCPNPRRHFLYRKPCSMPSTPTTASTSTCWRTCPPKPGAPSLPRAKDAPPRPSPPTCTTCASCG